MKKLPELRRKLSLRTSSRAHRQADDSRGGGDECGMKNVTSLLTLSNQNVISRYHLDSSAPPTRPLRQSLRGCSVSKGGKGSCKESRYDDKNEPSHVFPAAHTCKSKYQDVKCHLFFQVILAMEILLNCCLGTKVLNLQLLRKCCAMWVRSGCTRALIHLDAARGWRVYWQSTCWVWRRWRPGTRQLYIVSLQWHLVHVSGTAAQFQVLFQLLFNESAWKWLIVSLGRWQINS